MKILGDYHTHTYHSDGIASVLDMVQAAKECGLKEVAISDHGFGKLFNGMKKKKFESIFTEIEAARNIMKESDGPAVMCGVEANITNLKGAIDVDDEMRKKFDVILMGVHVNVKYSFGAMFGFLLPNIFWRILHWTPKGRIRKNTEVVKRAIERNNIDVWTHPNLYFKVDVVEVAKVCAQKGTLLELNGARISFRPIDFERILATGAKFIINSDAHCPSRVGEAGKVFEFLKDCDFKDDDIINLNQTLTAFRKRKGKNNDELLVSDKERVTAKKRRWWFSRHRT